MKMYTDKAYLYNAFIVEGKMIKEIANELNCSVPTIQKWLAKHNIKKEPLFMKMNREFGHDIESKYLEDGLLIKDIAELYDVHYDIISKVLKERGITLKSRSQIKNVLDDRNLCRVYSLDFDYFKKWSHNMAYILGLISTDGNIVDNGKDYKMRIRLKNEDSEKKLLLDVKQELKYDGELIEYEINSYKTFKAIGLEISSRSIVNDIVSLGITPNKSLTMELPNIPKEYIVDYIRGCLDGDGSLSISYPTNKHGVKTLSPQLRFRLVSGSEQFLIDIREQLFNLGIDKVEIGKTKTNLYRLEYSTKSSVKICNMMYKNESINLNRKKGIFENYLLLSEEYNLSKRQGQLD